MDVPCLSAMIIYQHLKEVFATVLCTVHTHTDRNKTQGHTERETQEIQTNRNTQTNSVREKGHISSNTHVPTDNRHTQ